MTRTSSPAATSCLVTCDPRNPLAPITSFFFAPTASEDIPRSLDDLGIWGPVASPTWSALSCRHDGRCLFAAKGGPVTTRQTIEADYLVVGAGAMGMAFTDTLIT